MNWMTFVPPAIAFAAFLVLGVVTWSYRDVYNRHSDRTASDEATSGHTDQTSRH